MKVVVTLEASDSTSAFTLHNNNIYHIAKFKSTQHDVRALHVMPTQDHTTSDTSLEQANASAHHISTRVDDMLFPELIHLATRFGVSEKSEARQGREALEADVSPCYERQFIGRTRTHRTTDLQKQDIVGQDEVTRRSDTGKSCDKQIQDDALEVAAKIKEVEHDLALGSDSAQAGKTAPGSNGTLESDWGPLQDHRLKLTQSSDAEPEDNTHLAKHEDCSQIQMPVDGLRLAKEPHSAEPACTAGEGRATTQVNGLLSTVTFTESPTFAAWVPCSTPVDPQIRLSNVLFRGCEQSSLILGSSCEFENVTFINCKFDRTTFQNVKLSGVTISHVGFEDTAFYQLRLQNVTLSKLQFTCDVWRSTCLKHALVGKDSFIKQPRSTRNYGLRSTAASSKTEKLVFKIMASLDDLKHTFRRAVKRDIHLFQSAPSGDILTRLAGHQNIIDHIMQYCFPGSDVHIYEYPYRSKKPAVSAKSRYLYGFPIHWEGDVFYSSPTLFGSLQPNTPVRTKPPGGYVPQRGVSNCTGLLTVSKAFSALALKYLYGRALHLQCRPEVAKAFLTVHAPRLKGIKQLILYYHWSEDKFMFTTDLDAWRHLLGTIRHEFPFIPNIRLHIGRSFWFFNTWSLGAQCVLDDIKCCPLAEAHKFAAPADRRRVKGDRSTHRADGTVLQIHIENTTTPEKIDFVKQLIDEIEKRRVGRPLFVRSPEGKEIIYRCADQFWESRRS
jgi:hypothetical protein